MPTPGPEWSVSPENWGAQVDYDGGSNTYKPTEGLVLHHGGGGNYRAHLQPYSVAEEQKQLRAWEDYHLGKGWRGIAYNWALGQSGNTYRLRGWNRPGAHTGDMDSDGIPNNTELGAVLFIGSGSHVALSADAQTALVRLRGYINDECGENFSLYGHTEASGNTECPGPKLMAYVTTHRLLEEDDMPSPKDWTAEDWQAVRTNTAGNVWGADGYTMPDPTSGNQVHPNTLLRAIRSDTAAVRGQLAAGIDLNDMDTNAIVAAVVSAIEDWDIKVQVQAALNGPE